MDWPPGVFEAAFVSRPNRYLTFCEKDGAQLRCFCPDPGRLAEFVTPGRRVLLAPSTDPLRRTQFTQLAFHHDGEWVSIVTAAANKLAKEAWAAGLLPEIPPDASWRAEVTHGASRLDYEISRPGQSALLVEVKSVTLCIDGEARFPDAPTVRGARHVRELAAHARGGGSAMLIFVQQRECGSRVRAHEVRDPDFAAALQEASDAGVAVVAVACRVALEGVAPTRRIPVLI